MNNLYFSQIITQSDDFVELKVTFSKKDHEVFQAHFPTNSLLPGFLQIDIVAQELSLKVIEVKKAKFLQPILPEDEVNFLIKIKESSINVVTKKDDKKCSEFTIVTA